MKIVGWITFTIVSMVVLTIIRALVLQETWRWFIASKFSLPQLGLVDAMGLSLVVGFLTYQRIPGEKDKSVGEVVVTDVCTALAFYGLVYVVAVVLHAFQ
jgi:hypothetical protein